VVASLIALAAPLKIEGLAAMKGALPILAKKLVLQEGAQGQEKERVAAAMDALNLIKTQALKPRQAVTEPLS